MLNVTNHQRNANYNHNEIPVGMAIINKSTRKKDVGKDVEKREHFSIVGGNADWYSHYGKQYGDTSKNYKWIWLLIQQSHFWE